MSVKVVAQDLAALSVEALGLSAWFETDRSVSTRQLDDEGVAPISRVRDPAPRSNPDPSTRPHTNPDLTQKTGRFTVVHEVVRHGPQHPAPSARKPAGRVGLRVDLRVDLRVGVDVMMGGVAHHLKFGWLSPVIGNRWSDHQPIVVHQDQHILPTALPHFDSLWIADHFYGFDAKTDPFLEAWTTLTWLAARHDHVTLCHHVLGHGYRPPALTAKMAATLQTLSGGRFVLGIGAGWRQDEYDAYGYDFPKASVRFAQLEEVVHICRLMWTQDEATFEGVHYRIENAAAPPLPLPVPRVCIGASGERVGLPLVGRIADMWNGSSRGTDDDWLRRLGIVRASAEQAGRDPDEIEATTTLERALPLTDDDSEQLVVELSHRAEMGVDHVVMDFGNPRSTEPVLRFVEQVITPLRA